MNEISDYIPVTHESLLWLDIQRRSRETIPILAIS